MIEKKKPPAQGRNPKTEGRPPAAGEGLQPAAPPSPAPDGSGAVGAAILPAIPADEQAARDDELRQALEDSGASEGGPGAAASAAPPAQDFTAQHLKPFFRMVGGFAARLTGCPDVEFTPGEVDALADTAAPVANRYLPPNLKDSHKELVAFGLVASGVAGAKYLAYEHHKKTRAAAKAEAAEEMQTAQV